MPERGEASRYVVSKHRVSTLRPSLLIAHSHLAEGVHLDAAGELVEGAQQPEGREGYRSAEEVRQSSGESEEVEDVGEQGQGCGEAERSEEEEAGVRGGGGGGGDLGQEGGYEGGGGAGQQAYLVAQIDRQLGVHLDAQRIVCEEGEGGFGEEGRVQGLGQVEEVWKDVREEVREGEKEEGVEEEASSGGC